MPASRAVGRVSELGGRGQRPLEGHTDRPANTGDSGRKGSAANGRRCDCSGHAANDQLTGKPASAIQLKYAAALPREGSVRVASYVAEPSLLALIRAWAGSGPVRPPGVATLGTGQQGGAMGRHNPWDRAERITKLVAAAARIAAVLARVIQELIKIPW